MVKMKPVLKAGSSPATDTEHSPSTAMPATAAVSPMTAAEFHDKMEGLGMLMSLPVDFSVRDVEKMMTALEGLAG